MSSAPRIPAGDQAAAKQNYSINLLSQTVDVLNTPAGIEAALGFTPQAALGFTPVQQGTGTGQNPANNVKLGWNGSTLLGQVDSTPLGSLILSGLTATITVGYNITPANRGTISSGTFTPAAANGNYQFYTNNGAHTFAAPAADSAIDILVTNGASAGAITFSGFTGGTHGDALDTTNTHQFFISVRRVNGTSAYIIKALQ